MKVRVTQIDGELPNLALMKLAHWHRAQGHDVVVTRRIEPDLFEGPYDRVYGSAIFKFSSDRLARFQQQWPSAIVGGTGTSNPVTVEEVIGAPGYNQVSYDGWGGDESLGFTQRGCRLKCKFCVVPTKEGKNRAVGTIAQIWRGGSHPKKIHLLDNDFFGQPEPDWRARIKEIRDGNFRVSLSQGINVRLINQAAAEALSTIEYRSKDFSRRRLYTAWDNIGDEAVFFRGVDVLARAGISPEHLMAYMLVGFDKRESWPAIWHRFGRMVELGIKPYPMVYDRARKDLCAFQRYVNLGIYRIASWADYDSQHKPAESLSGSYSPHRALVVA